MSRRYTSNSCFVTSAMKALAQTTVPVQQLHTLIHNIRGSYAPVFFSVEASGSTISANYNAKVVHNASERGGRQTGVHRGANVALWVEYKKLHVNLCRRENVYVCILVLIMICKGKNYIENTLYIYFSLIC